MTAASLAARLIVVVATLHSPAVADGLESQATFVDELPDFETDIIPILTKAGCNSGSCHGAAIGRGGFKLSLLGYEAAADYDRLVNEFEGRRVNRAFPAKSLVLRKPSLDLAHEGGLRLDPATGGFEILKRWIAAGTPRGGTRTLERIEVSPSSIWLAEPGDQFDIQVIGHFRDGDRTLVRNVTSWSVMAAADEGTASIGHDGRVTALSRGQSCVSVRFLGEVSAVTLTVPLGDRPITYRPALNYVDDSINRTLDDLRIPQSPQANDQTFIRRVFLDLIGTLPSPAEIEHFLKDDRIAKRNHLVNRLLDRSEFVDLWSYKWGELLRIESRRLQPAGVSAYHRWIRECVANDTPLNEMARTLILASGDSYIVGPANFHRVPNDARAEAEHVSRVFLGVRLQCANCHNHPLDRWTQDDYHGLAAMFARIDRSREVRVLSRGDATHPKTGLPATPKIPGGPLVDRHQIDPRERLVSWLTEPNNQLFARAAVNRVWRDLMGRGLVEPVDDHRATNPGTHPALLDALARDFIEHGFSVKQLIRAITSSEAYQRASQSVAGNATDDRFYSRYMVRPLPPHVLVDAVSAVTGVPEQLGDAPLGTRAISLSDSRVASEPLDLLGRCARDGECTPGAAAGSLPLTLHTINGEWLNAKIHKSGGLIERRLAQGSDSSFIQECYLTALGRHPTSAELGHWLAQFAGKEDRARREVGEDFLWALLNCAEFCFNH
jgi:hypothetical protein